MSKSLGNYIGINESAQDIFGKIMSLPDHMMGSFFELTTDITPGELQVLFKSLD